MSTFALVLIAQLFAAGAPARAKAPATRPSDAEVRRGVRCARPGRCTVSRALVERLLADTDALGADAHVAPVVSDGKPAGWALSAIRRGSVFARLGLRDGDVVQSVNGLDVSTPATAMMAFLTLRNANHFTVRIVRRGEPQTLDYSIR